jgi:hypothetical protein
MTKQYKRAEKQKTQQNSEFNKTDMHLDSYCAPDLSDVQV